MKLSARDKKVLACVEQRAEEPMALWRKITGLRDHTLRYTLKRLTDAGVLVGRVPFIDMYRLGLVDHCFYFSVVTQHAENREKLLRGLCELPNVGWLAEIGGDYQYAASLLVSHIAQAARMLMDFSEKFGNIFTAKAVTVRMTFHAFGRKYLWPAGAPPPPLGYGSLSETQEICEVDDTDREILAGLSNLQYRSLRELSGLLKIPPRTVERRVKQLEECGVIRGYIFRVSGALLGAEQYKLLLYTRGINPRLARNLLTFAKKHPNVLNLSECVGPWDYELGVEAYTPQEVAQIARQVAETFPQDVTQVQYLTIFKHLKFSGYPLSAKAAAADPKRIAPASKGIKTS